MSEASQPKVPAGTPFRRAIMLVQAMREIINLKLSALDQQQRMAELAPYRSRGKGRSKPFIKSWFSTRAFNTSNYKLPHQSERERARRVRQLAKGIL